MLGYPMANLFILARSQRRSSLFLFSFRNQSPSGWIMEFHVEVRHCQSPVWIPKSASSNVQQSSTRLRKYFATIDKAQFHPLSPFQRFWENYGDNVVSTPRQLRPFQSLILNKVHWISIRIHFLNF